MNRERRPLWLCQYAVLLGLMISPVLSFAQNAPAFIGGTQPDRRPLNAPIQTQPLTEQKRERVASHGISAPIPGNIPKIIKDQGGWYTPFNRPGMTSYYDLRGWHAKDPKAVEKAGEHLNATYSAWHTPEKIVKARNEDCLQCHQEILTEQVRSKSPAGLEAEKSKAWYQTTLSVYEGKQETFHWRHLESPLAKRTMNLTCNFCHNGHDPRDETVGSSATTPDINTAFFTLRKTVNPETTCLKCHGQFNAEVMGLPDQWHKIAETMNNDCMVCHATIRTERHNVTYLQKNAIEEEGKANSDTCYGCHGGRAWYRISYPYPRTPWPGMPEETPAWAKDRPTQSEPRYRLTAPQSAKK
ncbi:MAG: hypothetical protein N2557_01405 [Hydrogenophilus sp.]|nr:hypothetical protein [Hydrogenophilus sp.]